MVQRQENVAVANDEIMLCTYANKKAIKLNHRRDLHQCKNPTMHLVLIISIALISGSGLVQSSQQCSFPAGNENSMEFHSMALLLMNKINLSVGMIAHIFNKGNSDITVATSPILLAKYNA